MQSKQTKKKSVGVRILTVFLSVLVVLLAILFVFIWMLFNDPNSGRSMPHPSNAAVSKVVSAAVSGTEVDLKPEEVGSLVNFYLENNINADSGTEITAVSVTANENGTADIYTPIRYRGKEFGVVVNTLPSFDPSSEQLKFEVQSVQVGRLAVPVGLAMDFIKSKLPTVFIRDGNTLLCSTKSLFRLNYFGLSAQLKMTDMKLENKIFIFKFKAELGLAG